MSIGARAQELVGHLAAIGPVVVAYSGGTDSALVLAAATRAVGPAGVLACTALSASYPSGELDPAQAFAATLGVKHQLSRTDELGRTGYRANGRDRCYFCKSEVLDVICALADERGIAAVATGANADDAVDPFRPGIRAGDERNVHTPLRELGFGKDEVRAVSRFWELPTWSKPASPCLASRIKHGVQVTEYRLARIDRAETAVWAALTAAGIATVNLRVRDLGVDARVEIDQHAAVAAGDRADLAGVLASAGFTGRVEVAAFSSGALSREAS